MGCCVFPFVRETCSGEKRTGNAARDDTGMAGKSTVLSFFLHLLLSRFHLDLDKALCTAADTKTTCVDTKFWTVSPTKHCATAALDAVSCTPDLCCEGVLPTQVTVFVGRLIIHFGC